MAAKTKKKPKTDPLLAQAQAEKDVQYGPQFAQAQSLLGEAGETLKSDIETAKNNQEAVHAFAESQKAPTIERYKQSIANMGDYEKNTASALEGTGPVADIFRRAIGGSQQSSRSRTEGAGTRASQSLSDVQVSAMSGRKGAENQARGDYRKTKKSLTDQIQTLLGQKQADVMNRFGQLVENAAKNQNAIDVAQIAADAKRDVAAAGATNKANTQEAKDKEKETKRVEDIRSATGSMKQNVADIIDLWKGYASRVKYRPNPDKKTNAEFPYLNPDGNPVKLKESAEQKRMTPDEIKAAIQQETDYEPGLVHVALLVRSGQPLDDAAVSYLKSNRKWRIPREWLPKSMTPKHLPDRYGGAGRGADTT